MKWAQKIIFVTLIVGIFFIVLNIDIKPKRSQFKLCKPAEVSKVVLQYSGLDYAILKNASGAYWEVEYAGDNTRADDDTVRTFLTLACYLPYREAFSLMTAADAPQRADYGLNPPEVSMTVFAKKTVRKYFGNATPSGTEYYYTNSQAENKVYTVPNLFYRGLVVKPFDFKNRLLLADLNSEAEKIVISFAQTQLELTRKDKSWQDPRKSITDEQAHVLVEFLSSFHFKSYHGPLTEEDFAYFGIQDPDVIIEISRTNLSKTETYTLSSIGSRYYLSVLLGTETYLPILNGNSPIKFLKILRDIALQLPSS